MAQFKCSHPSTPENTYSWTARRKNRSGMTVCYQQSVCKACATARNAAKERAARRRLGPMDKAISQAKDAALMAQGRCKACHLMLPCGSSHSARELAENRQAMTMPEGGW